MLIGPARLQRPASLLWQHNSATDNALPGMNLGFRCTEYSDREIVDSKMHWLPSSSYLFDFPRADLNDIRIDQNSYSNLERSVQQARWTRTNHPGIGLHLDLPHPVGHDQHRDLSFRHCCNNECVCVVNVQSTSSARCSVLFDLIWCQCFRVFARS